MKKFKLAATSCLTFLLVATAVIFSVGALTGCDDDGEKCITGEGGNAAYDLAAANGEKTTIKVYADGEDYMKALITAFEAEYPTINVEHVQVGSVDARARMQLEGKDGADVFVFPHDHVGLALQGGLLAEMPSAIASRLEQTLQASTMDTISSNGKYYGVPLSAETLAVFYNEDLLIDILTDLGKTEEAQELATKPLEEVLTLDEIVELSYEYNNVQEKQYLFSIDIDNFYHNFAFLTAFGYEIFGPNGTDPALPNFNTDAVREGLAWVQKYAFLNGDTNGTRVLPAASTLTEADYLASFNSGEAAMIVTGPWNISSCKEAAETEGFTLKVTSLPTINVDGTEQHPVTFSGVQVAAVSQYSSKKDAAWTFTEYMVSVAGAGILYNETGKLPCLIDTTQIDGLSEDPLLGGISKQLAYSQAMPSITEMGYMWDIGAKLVGDVFDGQDIDSCITTAMNSYSQLVTLG